MSYPMQPYNPINVAVIDQKFNRGMFNGNNSGGGGGDILGSLLGFANQLMGEILRNGPDIDGIASFGGSDPNNPQLKIFGVSSMNVTQISPGVDGRPQIVEAHDERWMGPGGIWQTKKTLRDPQRGIEKTQIGRFAGDRSEVIERRLDPSTGQYRQDIQQHAIAPNQPNYSLPWQKQSQHAMQQQPALPPPLPLPPLPSQFPYYSRQQQQIPPYTQPLQHYPAYTQQPQQYLPYTQPSPYTQKPQKPSPYTQKPPQQPSPYTQQPPQPFSSYTQKPRQHLPLY